MDACALTNDQDQLHFFRPRQLAQRDLCGGPLYCLLWESVLRDLLHKFYVFPKWQTVRRQMHGLKVNLQYQFFNLLGSFILRATQHDTTVLLLADCKAPW